MLQKLHNYVEMFNQHDDEYHSQTVPNDKAEQFLAEQIPLLECPDKDLEKIYYFRWWTFRKHLQKTDRGYVITEFLPPVPWGGPYNTINCPACFHIREGRWLKNANSFVKDYINFWLDEGGFTYRYSAWYAHAVLEYCALQNDYAYAVEKLPQLIEIFENREKKHKRGTLYWASDWFDGMEYSISGSGLRPTRNSYACADALAISEIARIAGDTQTQERYARKAEEIKSAMDAMLWDGDFYKTIPLEEGEEVTFSERPTVAPSNDVKELVGYIPWYFGIPDSGKETAFSELLSKNGFKAPYGLTSAQQSHPRFMEEHNHECLWNGSVWPFATSQVLVALGNLLHDYDQSVISKEDYYAILLQYAKSHSLTKEDGIVVPWIDECIHPYTGRWMTRDVLKEWGWRADKGGFERGKDYNHSLFCDLILSGLLGIAMKDGELTVEPLIPDSWEYFKVDNLWLNGKRYSITYDKTGTHYNVGTGLMIQHT